MFHPADNDDSNRLRGCASWFDFLLGDVSEGMFSDVAAQINSVFSQTKGDCPQLQL